MEGTIIAANYIILPLAYLLGAFPSALIVTRIFKKTDIRSSGSGNVGAMNAYKVAGLLPGLLTVSLDIGKGILAVYLGRWMGAGIGSILAAAFLVVLGHNYNILIGMRGGKGLATTLGVLLALSPAGIIYILPAGLLLSFLLRDTNTAFGLSALLIPPVLWWRHNTVEWLILGLLLAVLILVRHRRDFNAYRGGRRQLF